MDDLDITAFFDAFEGGDIGTHDLDRARFFFKGYWWDPHIRKYFVRHRVYDPLTFRWMQRDPLGLAAGPNLYDYCRGNPVDFYDPYGLWDWDNDWIEYGLGGLLGFHGSEPFKEALKGAHDGLVVTSNVIVNTASFGAAGMTRSELDQGGHLFDPDNPELDISEVAGKVAGSAIVGAAVVATGGALAPGVASTMTGSIVLGMGAGYATEASLQTYEINNGDITGYDPSRLATGTLVGGAFAGAGNWIAGRLGRAAACPKDGAPARPHASTSGGVRSANGTADAAQGAKLREYYRQAEKYGAGGTKQLENGRYRFYGEMKPANTPGTMAGRRLVREWDPVTGNTRTWHETVDQQGIVRRIRPVTGGPKIHYDFDEGGNYVGQR